MFSPPRAGSRSFTNETPRSVALVQGADVGAVGSVTHEVAAPRNDELGLASPLRSASRAPARVRRGRLDGLDRALDRAGGAELVNDRCETMLGEMYVLVASGDRGDQVGRANKVATRIPGKPSLRTRRRTPPRVDRQHRGQRLAAEPQRDIGVVLEHDEPWSAASSSRRGRFSYDSV